MSNRKRWTVVVLYAAAMAWVESAVVYYLRTMIHRLEPHQPDPLPVIGYLGTVELVREAATMVMLLAVGILAGKTWRSRLGYAAIAFGAWDIFYYVFLKWMCGWPHSLFDWDILFLLPLPWWGPVLAPMAIAALMVAWGTLVGQREHQPAGSRPWKAWLLNAAGVGLALYVFMADCLRVADQGVEALRQVLPTWFNWPLFCLALLLMAAPLLQMLWTGNGLARALDVSRWLEHFERNRKHRPEPDWDAPLIIIPDAMPWLVRSLEQFQLGDGGGPASLIARDADRFRNSTPQMRRLVDLWFAEEREHSRLLGCAVARFGGQRIRSHWSFTAFCLCCRLLGVRFELQVLLLTEITSTAYYRLLQRHCRIPALEAMCALILRDEGGHVAFHRERLAAAGRSPSTLGGYFWALQFRACGYAAATMLWVNHSRCLAGLGGSAAEFYREVSLELERFLHGLEQRASTRPETGEPSELREPNVAMLQT